MSYIQGYLIPVKVENKEAYIEVAKQSGQIFLDHGVTRIVEGWGDDLMDGKVTDFKKAVLAEEGENVVFAWAFWPDKETYENAKEGIENDPRLSLIHI